MFLCESQFQINCRTLSSQSLATYKVHFNSNSIHTILLTGKLIHNEQREFKIEKIMLCSQVKKIVDTYQSNHLTYSNSKT